MKISECISRSKRHDLPISSERMPFAVCGSGQALGQPLGPHGMTAAQFRCRSLQDVGLKQGQALTGTCASAQAFELGRSA